MSVAEQMPTTACWPARLRLQFATRGERTVMSHCSHRGPLRVQRPFYPEGAPCHVYVLHPPGGVVGGDTLDIDVEVQSTAHALLTTPAATKFYRCDQRIARQQQSLHVREHAKLEWLPQDAIVFNGSNAESATRVELEADARFVGWELFTLGRPACAEQFSSGFLSQRLEVWRDQVPLLIERTRFRGQEDTLKAQWGLQGRPSFATMIATPARKHTLEAARSAANQLASKGVLVAFTLKGDLLVGRGIAQAAPALQQVLSAVWHAIRTEVMECEPCEPRIWRT